MLTAASVSLECSWLSAHFSPGKLEHAYQFEHEWKLPICLPFPPIHHLCVCGSQWNVADSGASTQVLVISVLDVPLRGYLTSLGQHRSNETEKGLLLRAHSQKYSYSKGPSLERFSLPSRWAHWKSQFKARPCTHVCTRTLMLESRVLTPVRRHY